MVDYWVHFLWVGSLPFSATAAFAGLIFLYFRYDIDYISNRYRMALVHFLGNIHILYGSRTGQPAKSNSWQDLTNPVIRYIHYD